jgi:hypothetical protein
METSKVSGQELYETLAVQGATAWAELPGRTRGYWSRRAASWTRDSLEQYKAHKGEEGFPTVG